MTKLLAYATIQNTGGDGAGAPGGAPGNTSISQQQSNPQSSQYTPNGNYPPTPLTGGVAQTVLSPLSHDQMSRGNIPLNTQPTNIGTGTGFGGAGTDSVLAAMARGQILLSRDTYGQGGFVPQNGGASPQVPSAPANGVQSQANGIASTLTVAVAPIGD